MKKNIILLILFALSVVVKANDGSYYTSGNQLIPLKESSISVSKEILTISIGDNRYATVDVYYEFINPDKDRTILMGFEADRPLYDVKYSFEKSHPFIYDFKVEMNGKPIEYKNYITIPNTAYEPVDFNKWDLNFEAGENYLSLKSNPDSLADISYVYSFNAPFIPGKNIVHHIYRYKLGKSVEDLFDLEYKLTPATRWANHQIDDFTLRINVDNTAKNFIVRDSAFMGVPFKVIKGIGKMRTGIQDKVYEGHTDDHYTEFTLRDGMIEWHCTNFKPKNEIVLFSADVLYRCNFEEPVKTGYFYDRTAYIEDLYPSNFRDLTPRDKRILRNLPYAHRGYVFKDKELQKFFDRQWWYMPDENWKLSTRDFTKDERELLKLVVK